MIYTIYLITHCLIMARMTRWPLALHHQEHQARTRCLDDLPLITLLSAPTADRAAASAVPAPRPPRPGRRCVCPDRRRRGRCRRRSGRSRHEGARACATWVSAGGRHARVTSRLSRRAHSRLFSSLPFIAPRHRLLPVSYTHLRAHETDS